MGPGSLLASCLGRKKGRLSWGLFESRSRLLTVGSGSSVPGVQVRKGRAGRATCVGGCSAPTTLCLGGWDSVLELSAFQGTGELWFHRYASTLRCREGV